MIPQTPGAPTKESPLSCLVDAAGAGISHRSPQASCPALPIRPSSAGSTVGACRVSRVLGYGTPGKAGSHTSRCSSAPASDPQGCGADARMVRHRPRSRSAARSRPLFEGGACRPHSQPVRPCALADRPREPVHVAQKPVVNRRKSGVEFRLKAQQGKSCFWCHAVLSR